jgi:hypothetical protein
VPVTDPGTLVIFPESAAEVARYDLEPGRAGRVVATFQATTAGPYRVLAVGQDIAPSLVLTRLGAVILALMTVLTAVPLAVVTARLGPERFGDPLPGRAFARSQKPNGGFAAIPTFEFVGGRLRRRRRAACRCRP